MYRRDADVCAGRHPSWAAPARVTTEVPAVRVLGGGGGGPRLRGIGLTQRRELQGRLCGLAGRVDSPAHQLAERALGRSAAGRRGEHVFGKLRTGPDGTATAAAPESGRSRPIWLCSAAYAGSHL